MPESHKKRKTKEATNPIGWQAYLSLGSQFMVLLGLGVFVGIKLDAYWNISPLLIILLPTLALVLSLIHLYRKLVR